MNSTSTRTTTPPTPAHHPVYAALVRWQQSGDLRYHVALWCYAWFDICARDKSAHRIAAYRDGAAEIAALLQDYDTVDALHQLYLRAGLAGGDADAWLDWALARVCLWPTVDPRNHDGRHRVALARSVVWKAALWWRVCEIVWGHAPARPPDNPPLRCRSAAILAAAANDATMAMERLAISSHQHEEHEEHEEAVSRAP